MRVNIHKLTCIQVHAYIYMHVRTHVRLYMHAIHAKTKVLTTHAHIYKINASNAMPELYLTVYIRKLWPEVTVDGLGSLPPVHMRTHAILFDAL